jgi:serine/threonine protein kinase/tetratricopeptide (TPR) repeat protein
MSSPSPPHRAVGRYILYDPIASGGMATVHLGKLRGSAGFSRTVAIKRLHPHLATDKAFVAMFVDEARLATRIRHPNVVATLDVVTDEGELFLVLDYVEGESLSRLLHTALELGEPPPPKVVIALACDVLHGLHAAHEARDERGEPLGIVHRDVSPQNVIVAVDGTARVLDFGVAKARRRLQTTLDGSLKGKIAYMAPEQIGGEATRASDVFAAGIVLWEGLTVRRLFEAENEAALMARIMTRDADAPSSLAKRPLPEPARSVLDAIVLKALSREPSARYPTALAMATALEEAGLPATRAEVADWVKRSAREALEDRSRQVKNLESDVTLAPGLKVDPPARAEDAKTRHAPMRALAAKAEEPSAGPVVAPAAPRKPVQRALTLAAFVLVLAAGAGMIVKRYRTAAGPPTGEPEAPDASSAFTACVILTDCPPPSTSSPEARAAYQAGLQSLRDASFSAARTNFEHAATFDPGLAAAHLRLAISSSMFAGETDTRRMFARAEGLRSSLSERDRVLLRAFEPYFHPEMGDVAECVRRLDEASARVPRDGELAFYLGFLRFQQGQLEGALSALDRAIDIDPELGAAWSERGGVLGFMGRFDEATQDLDHCIQMSPLATDCIWYRAALDEQMGRCGDVEADAKRAISKEPDNYFGYSLLANALIAEGRSAESVTAALEAKWKKSSPKSRPRVELHDRMNRELLVGHFSEAERDAHELQALAASAESSASYHALPAWTLVEIYTETGRPALARDTARQFLEREGAWTAPFRVDDVALARDVSPRMLMTLLHTGAIGRSELRARRTEWLDAWRRRTSGVYLHHLWFYGYAAGVDSHDDAMEALESLSLFHPLPVFTPQSMTDAYLGRVYERAGRLEEARTPLRAATSSCTAFRYPITQTLAFLDLGAALEGSDPKGACDAYATVVSRWGSAKPRSASATQAKKRMEAMHCTLTSAKGASRGQ